MSEKFGGAICGGVISKSLFDSDPWAYMMSYYMEDRYFNQYRRQKQRGLEKEAQLTFKKYARSAI